MNKTPFFSIPIATYNREGELDFAIKRILAQSFTDFELIISDDHSTDNTEKIVKKYKDKRVRYYRNNNNFGAVKNIGKVLTYAKGKYIFLHGDDDFLLYDGVLQKTYDLLQNEKFGLIRWNYLYQSHDKRSVFDYFRNKFENKDIKISPHKKPLEVLNFIEKIDLYFISGIVFKNPYPKKISILHSEFIPWFPDCYSAIIEGGGYHDSDHVIVASWSHQKRNPVYYVENGKLPWEELYESMRKVSNEEYYREALNKQLAVSVSFLPTIKYNSDNSNLLLYSRRIRELTPYYNFSVKFWILFFIAFILPKFFLKFVRDIYIKRTQIFGTVEHHKKIVKRIRELRNFDV